MATNGNYGLSLKTDYSYEEALEKVKMALQEQGFGVLTEIDLQAALKKKLDVDTGKYIILGACNPKLAYQALQSEQEIGLLLPCNVIVYEHETGRATISILNPSIMVEMAGNPALDDVSREARQRLERVIATLAGARVS